MKIYEIPEENSSTKKKREVRLCWREVNDKRGNVLSGVEFQTQVRNSRDEATAVQRSIDVVGLERKFPPLSIAKVEQKSSLWKTLCEMSTLSL